MFWSRLAPAITQSTPCPRKATPATSVSAFRITIISYTGSIDGSLAILHSRPRARALRLQAGGHCRVHGGDAGRARLPETDEPHRLSARVAGAFHRGGTVLPGSAARGPRQRGGPFQPGLHARQARATRARDPGIPRSHAPQSQDRPRLVRPWPRPRPARAAPRSRRGAGAGGDAATYEPSCLVPARDGAPHHGQYGAVRAGRHAPAALRPESDAPADSRHRAQRPRPPGAAPRGLAEDHLDDLELPAGILLEDQDRLFIDQALIVRIEGLLLVGPAQGVRFGVDGLGLADLGDDLLPVFFRHVTDEQAFRRPAALAGATGQGQQDAASRGNHECFHPQSPGTEKQILQKQGPPKRALSEPAAQGYLASLTTVSPTRFG